MRSILPRIVLAACCVMVLTFAKNSPVQAQVRRGPAEPVACTIDLGNPGTMSDVLSNALHQGLNQRESEVREFLTKAKKEFRTGHQLAMAAAKAFDVEEKLLFEKIEAFKHINCEHEGGGAFPEAPGRQSQNDRKLSGFAENVLFHVILHELAHGLVREFDLPVLANEETLADTFATHYAVTRLPERAPKILEARIVSLMIEAGEVPRNQWTVKGEHNADARRAYQIAAIAIAWDPAKYAPLGKRVGMEESDIRKAADYGSEIHRSWRRVLQPLQMPDGQKSNEVRVRIQDDSVFRDALMNAGLVRDIEEVVRSFDWHSQVTIRFESGEGGAGWSRSARTISVHDEYVDRFNRQADLRSKKD